MSGVGATCASALAFGGRASRAQRVRCGARRARRPSCAARTWAARCDFLQGDIWLRRARALLRSPFWQAAREWGQDAVHARALVLVQVATDAELRGCLSTVWPSLARNYVAWCVIRKFDFQPPPRAPRMERRPAPTAWEPLKELSRVMPHRGSPNWTPPGVAGRARTAPDISGPRRGPRPADAAEATPLGRRTRPADKGAWLIPYFAYHSPSSLPRNRVGQTSTSTSNSFLHSSTNAAGNA